MGGDRFTTHLSSIEDESSNDQDFSEQASDYSGQSCEGILRQKVENGSVNGASNFAFDEFGDMSCRSSSTSLASEVNRRRKQSLYAEVLATYDDLQPRSESLKEAKNKILSYTPGSWIDKVGGFSIGDYHVPQTTTLLLIGPKGSGKSSLVNKISRSFEPDKFAPERAQVSNGSSVGQGTFFLQEYMIPRGSDSLCLYDTRALCDDSIENMKMLKQWLIRGVRHGELVQRASDDANLNSPSNFIVKKSDHFSGRVRMVNFVIMVVNGISVLESMDSDDDEGKKQYTEMIAATFNCPFLSFKDDKPVIVVTHGDLLTLTDRARLRVYLGNLLGVPPKTQIFDIPDGNNKVTELAIADLLSHCLERADRNLPPKAVRNRPSKKPFIGKINMLLLLACILLQGIGYIIPSMPGRFGLYKPPDPVNKPSDPAPLGVNKPLDPAPSGVNKPPDPAPGVNKPADLAPSTMNKPSDPALSCVNTPPDPASSAVNTPFGPASSAVNMPFDPAPSGVNKLADLAPSTMNKPSDPALSCVNTPLDPASSAVNTPFDPTSSAVNTPFDPAPSGVNKLADLAPSTMNKPSDPALSCVNTPLDPASSAMNTPFDPASSAVNTPFDPAPSGVNKLADLAPSTMNKPSDPTLSCVNTPPDPASSAVNTPFDPAPSSVNTPPDPSAVNKPAPSAVNTPPDPSGVNKPAAHSGVHVNWHKIRHLSEGVRINWHEIRHLWYDPVRINWHEIRHLWYAGD